MKSSPLGNIGRIKTIPNKLNNESVLLRIIRTKKLANTYPSIELNIKVKTTKLKILAGDTSIKEFNEIVVIDKEAIIVTKPKKGNGKRKNSRKDFDRFFLFTIRYMIDLSLIIFPPVIKAIIPPNMIDILEVRLMESKKEPKNLICFNDFKLGFILETLK